MRNTKETLTNEDIATYGLELSQTQRDMLLASLGNNYAYIASEFDIPIGTVKSRISRARAIVVRAKELGQHDPGFSVST